MQTHVADLAEGLAHLLDLAVIELSERLQMRLLAIAACHAIGLA